MGLVRHKDSLKVDTGVREILSFAWPISISILIPQVNILINSIFLGSLSTEALGNGGITAIFYLIFAIAGHGIGNAMQSVFSRYAGSDRTRYFRVIFTQGIRFSLAFSLFGIAVTYFLAPYILGSVADPVAFPKEIAFLKIRIWGLPFLYLFMLSNAFLVSSLNSRLLMIGFIMETAINIFLDYTLIFGHFGAPALGFNGAAWASVFAEISAVIIVFSVLIVSGLRKKYKLLTSFKFNAEITRQILKISFPLILQYFLSVISWLAFFIMIESKGTLAKAISNAMRSVFGFAGIVIWAFFGTANAMTSNLIGQRREPEVLTLLNHISLLSFSFCFAISLFLNLFPQAFLSLFSSDPEFVKRGISVLRIVTMGVLFMSLANVWLGGLAGTARTRINLFIEVFAATFYLVYTWYVLKVSNVSLALAWTNEFLYWMVILLMSWVYMRGRKWMTGSYLKH